MKRYGLFVACFVVGVILAASCNAEANQVGDRPATFGVGDPTDITIWDDTAHNIRCYHYIHSGANISCLVLPQHP